MAVYSTNVTVSPYIANIVNNAPPPQHIMDLIEADKVRNDELISEKVGSCCARHKMTLQQVETALRAYNCGFTYLIARKRTPDYEGVKFLFNSKYQDNYLYVCTGGKEKAMEMIKQESNDYNNNYSKLDKTGFLVYNSRRSKPSSLCAKMLSTHSHGKEASVSVAPKAQDETPIQIQIEASELLKLLESIEKLD